MPYHWLRIGPFGLGIDLEWFLPPWIDIERTADEVILTLRVPRDVKKEEIKVEFREGALRIRLPRKKEGDWEPIPIE